MIESRSHVGVYHYFRGFSIEQVSDFADAMNVEICHTTHVLYVVLHGKGIVEENSNILGDSGSTHGHVTQLNARHINVVLNTRRTYQYSVSFVGV